SGNGTAEIRELIGNRIFSNPKPLSLIKDFVILGSGRESIILDFFAGSSTSAHAVMELNAIDNGNRKYIMVQLPEETEKDSDAYQAGYNDIGEIGMARIKNAGDKVKTELQDKYDNASEEERKEIKHPDELDIGFKTFK